MPITYPYIISLNKIEPILSKVRSAARPERFSRETLSKWGFSASNDRAMVGIMRELGFVSDTGAPTELYDRLRDSNEWRFVLADRIRELYADLYAIDTAIHAAPEIEIKGAISRVSGKDDESVKRYYATFKTLAGLAKFDPRPTRATPRMDADEVSLSPPQRTEAIKETTEPRRQSEFHYNIQLHLPPTTDISVYNAIFKSLKEHLGL